MHVNREFPEPTPIAALSPFLDALLPLVHMIFSITNDSNFLSFYNETSDLINRHFPNPTIRRHTAEALILLAAFTNNHPGALKTFLQSHSRSPQPAHSVAQYFHHNALPTTSPSASTVQSDTTTHDETAENKPLTDSDDGTHDGLVEPVYPPIQMIPLKHSLSATIPSIPASSLLTPTLPHYRP
jgi:hypothetical protein